MTYTVFLELVKSNAPFLFLAFVILIWSLIKLGGIVWDQHKEIRRQQMNQEESQMSALVDKIEGLVDQISALFSKHDVHERRIDGNTEELRVHGDRLHSAEKKIEGLRSVQNLQGQELSALDSRCAERAKHCPGVKGSS